MEHNERLWNVHCLYNLARYIFLRIESEYNEIIERSGITLPQLRVLWIVKSFPGISLGEVAKIGCWAPPTVTKMLQILIIKGLMEKENYKNKKLYRLHITLLGDHYIDINKQEFNQSFPLWRLCNTIEEELIWEALCLFNAVAINDKNEIILEYIESINRQGLKVNYNQLGVEERKKAEKVVCFYNFLRTFILDVEGEHRQYLMKYNLTYPQLRALWIIKAFPGITSLQLSDIGFWAPSTVNVIVKNLCTKELIFKEKSKFKNSLYLYINRKGEEQIIQDLKENQYRLSIYRHVETIEQGQLERVNQLLDIINRELKNDLVDVYIERTFKFIKEAALNIQ